MLTNVKKEIIMNLFQNNGYDVLYCNFVWNGLTHTIYPECYIYNLNYIRKNAEDVRGGAWQLVLSNPNFANELDTPYIFCNLFDLKVQLDQDCPKHHQADIEDFWFGFVSGLVQSKRSFLKTKNVNFKDEKVREEIIGITTEVFDSYKDQYNSNGITPLRITKPTTFDPTKSLGAQVRINQMRQQVQNKDEMTK